MENTVETYSSPFSEPWEGSDVIIIVADQKLHVHSVILTMASPVFTTMLSCGIKESQTKEIELEGKKLHDVVVMLKVLYPQYQASLMGQLHLFQLKYLMAFSKEYMIDLLKTFVVKQGLWIAHGYPYDIKDPLLGRTVISLLEFADEENFKELVEKCITVLVTKANGTIGEHCHARLVSFDDLKNLSHLCKYRLCTEMLKLKLTKRDSENEKLPPSNAIVFGTGRTQMEKGDSDKLLDEIKEIVTFMSTIRL